MNNVYHSLTLCLYSILLFFITLGCNNSTESSQSVLSVDKETLTLSQMNNSGFFEISNAGEDELSWQIISLPDWLNISKVNGRVTDKADTVDVTADIYQSAGYYEGKIAIKSNGGSKQILVTYAVQFSIKVFPGTGAANIFLNDSYNEIIDEHGFSDTFITDFDSTGAIIGHIVQYLNKGLGFYLNGNGLTPQLTDSASRIIMEVPYEGVTENFIGIGSSLTEVQDLLGIADVVDTTSNFWGYSNGINFYYNEDSTIVFKMEVFQNIMSI
jgi:hypothetical protein